MTEEELRQLEAQAAIAEQQFQKDAAAIETLGKETFGAQTFDDCVNTLAERLGPERIRGFTQLASQFDSPHQLVVKIASDERRLDAISKMTPAQLATEIARSEAEMAPNGHTSTGREPAWKKLAKAENRILSDNDWNSGLGDRLDEAAWQRNWEKRQRDRAARSPQPLGTRHNRG